MSEQQMVDQVAEALDAAAFGLRGEREFTVSGLRPVQAPFELAGGRRRRRAEAWLTVPVVYEYATDTGTGRSSAAWLERLRARVAAALDACGGLRHARLVTWEAEPNGFAAPTPGAPPEHLAWRVRVLVAAG